MYRLEKTTTKGEWLVTVDRNETGFTVVRETPKHYQVFYLGRKQALSGVSPEEALSGARALHMLALVTGTLDNAPQAL